MFKNNISIIGGTGHVGLPLGLAFSKRKFKVELIDINKKNIDRVNRGILPFIEKKGKKLLKQSLKKKNIIATNELSSLRSSKFIIICIGTPIKKNLKPEIKNFLKFFRKLKNYLSRDQIIIIRSSVFPGICNKVYEILKSKNSNISYCPERIVQGKSLIELPKLPQIVSAFNKKAENQSAILFKNITRKIIFSSILEAELIKLFSNAYRYINFSITNDFYKICKSFNINYENLRKKMIDGYERNTAIPKAGFSAGPCLLKDTMQLASFTKTKFDLGYAAMKINQKLPIFLIKELEKKVNLKKEIIGIMGLSFKADVDDIRDSLSIELINYLKKRNLNFLYNDPYYKDPDNSDLKHLIKKSSIIIIATPHKVYKKVKIPRKKKIVDIWNIIKK